MECQRFAGSHRQRRPAMGVGATARYPLFAGDQGPPGTIEGGAAQLFWLRGDLEPGRKAWLQWRGDLFTESVSGDATGAKPTSLRRGGTGHFHTAPWVSLVQRILPERPTRPGAGRLQAGIL